MATEELWCRVVVHGPEGGPPATWVVSGTGDPDLAVVDGVSLLRLAAARAGATVEVRDVCPRLAELLDLVGLGGQPQGEPEVREDPLGVEEAVVPGDPSV